MDDIAVAAMDDRVVADIEHERLRAGHLTNVSTLSAREGEVLALALDGLSARAIAERLTLTEATVRSHLSRVFSKLGVAGRVELLAQMKGGTPLNSLPPNIDRPDENVQPDRPPRPLRRLGIVLFVGLAASVGLGLALLRPDLPPRTDLGSVSRLVSERQVSSLDLRGDTLFVSTTDGRLFRVDSVDMEAVGPIQAEAIDTSNRVSVSAGGDTLITSLAMLATALMPAVLVVIAVFATLRTLRRPPQPGPTG